MAIYPRVGGSNRDILRLSPRVGGSWRQGLHMWRYDADRPEDLDVDPPIEVVTGEGGIGVWVYCGNLSAPTETPQSPGQVTQDVFLGGSSYATRVRCTWDVPGNFPYGTYSLEAEIYACPDGVDIFTPSGDWAWWANAGAADATAETTQTIEQPFSWNATWVRCRMRFYNQVGDGPWSAWSTPSRVTLRNP